MALLGQGEGWQKKVQNREKTHVTLTGGLGSDLIHIGEKSPLARKKKGLLLRSRTIVGETGKNLGIKKFGGVKKGGIKHAKREELAKLRE